MVFNEGSASLLITKHSMHLKQWVFFICTFLILSQGHATKLKEFKKESLKYDSFMGVIYDVEHDKYSTLSNTNGELLLEHPENLIEIGRYSLGAINFKFSSYRQFLPKMQEKAESFALFKQLPRELNDILKIMGIIRRQLT